MSHIDEGALHAYLDGALDEYPAAEARSIREHLETCGECRERLESERRVRDDAAAMLGLAAPEVEVPTFEELRAYVQANAPRRSPWTVRLYRLGWAASIVLALGTGWILRGGDVVPVRSPVGTSLEVDGARQDAPSPGGNAVESRVRAEELDSGAPGAVEEERETQTQEVAATAEPERLAPSAQRSRVADVVPAPEADAFGDVAADDVPGPSAPAAGAADELAAMKADGSRRQELVASRSAEPTSAPAEPGVPASPLRERAADTSGVGISVDVERRSAPSDVVSSANSVGAAAGLTPVARSADAADADEVSPVEESYSLVVPGLEVLEVRFRGTGVRSEGQVVLQRLESGDTLQVIHLPPEMDVEVLEGPGPRDNQLVLQRATGWIVMRAPLDDGALLDLMGRLLGTR
jgi:hypothetical protein